MSRLSVLRWSRRHDDRGFTLAELLVAMVIGGVVLAGLGTMFASTALTTEATQSRIQSVNTAQLAVESISRNLRTAVLPSQLTSSDTTSSDAAFIQGTPTSVSFYGDIDNPNNAIGPSRVSYSVSGGVLSVTIQRPNAHAADDYNYQYCTPGPTCPVIHRVLASNVETSTPIFVYYDALGNQLATPLTADGLANVDTVELTITVDQTKSTDGQPTTYVERVDLPNHDAVQRQTAS